MKNELTTLIPSPLLKKRKVGKYIGSTVYIHRTAVNELPSDQRQMIIQAASLLPANHSYEVIKLQPKLKEVSFIDSDDWDTKAEPTVGDSFKVNLNTLTTRYIPARKNNRQLYHHKWMFVADDYKGFNVEESKLRSMEWELFTTKMNIDKKKIGNSDYWDFVVSEMARHRGIWSSAIPFPTTSEWQRGITWEEARNVQPTLFNGTTNMNDAAYQPHPTQVSTTVHTYQKIFESIKMQHPNYQSLKVLDASSGKGLGTTLGRNMGFKIHDIEMYPPRSYQPMYRFYEEIKQTYDVIVCNMVLNIITQDQRDKLVRKLSDLLNPGGNLWIIVRNKKEIEAQKTGIPFIENNCEYFFPSKRSYQKGFTKQELYHYVQDALSSPVFQISIKSLPPVLSTATGVIVLKNNK